MIVSTKGRYALRVMVELAQHQGDGYVPLNVIAERQDISEKYLESILKVLVQDKLLTGLRGRGGGYRLTKAPEDYTLGEILRLTEGSLAPVACTDDGEHDCPRKGICPSHPVWQKLDNMINEFFDGITLADLIQTAPQESLPFSFNHARLAL